jgi:hypothetical protein
MELDEIKYLYLLLYYIIGGVIFFNSYWKSKKSNAIWGFRIDKKLSPDFFFKPIF